MKKKFILVTGGAGFIGSSLIEFLLKKNLSYKILSLDNYFTGNIKNHINNANVKYIKGQNKDIQFLLRKYKKKN